jgi:hypothetical protein
MKQVLLTVMMAMIVMTNVTAFASEDAQFGRDRSRIGKWCQDKVRVLKNYKNRASSAYSYGKHQKSFSILKAGLIRASEQIQDYYTGSMTAKAIKRGLRVIDIMENDTSGEVLQIKTLNFFLFEYYNFIFKVAYKLDLPYYQSGRCYFCQINSHRKYEKLYVRFAKKQVQMVMNTMAEEIVDYGVPTITPLGDPKGFLSSLQFMTKAMAKDLEHSVYSRKFTCMISDLHSVSNDLRDGVDPDEYWAIQNSYYRVQQILGERNSCYNNTGDYDHHNDHGQYPHGNQDNQETINDIYSRDFKISEFREAKSLLLDKPVFVEKLIISGMGIREDAVIDVVVNGKVKRTIIFPPYDPTFYVDVNEYTGSVQFVSQKGKAKIQQVIVVKGNKPVDDFNW